MRSALTMRSFFALWKYIGGLVSSPKNAPAADSASSGVLSSENRPSLLCRMERSVSKKDPISKRPKSSSWNSGPTPGMTNSFSKNPDLGSKAERKKKRNPSLKNQRDFYKINLLKSLPTSLCQREEKIFPPFDKRGFTLLDKFLSLSIIGY